MNLQMFRHLPYRLLGNAAMLAATVLSATSCTSVIQTVAMENRLFVRVPGAIHEAPPEADGWSFRHVVEGPKIGEVTHQWYVAFRKRDRRDRLYHIPFRVPWASARSRAPELADACKKSLGAYPQLIEPGLIFSKWASKGKLTQEAYDAAAKEPKPTSPPKLEVKAAPLAVWPSKRTPEGHFDPVWHLDADHTQLADARERVRRESPSAAREIVIAHLDTGYDIRHAAMPKYLMEDLDGEAVQALRPEYDKCDSDCQKGRSTPGASLGSHGMGTLGILAAPKVELVDVDRPMRLTPAVATSVKGRGKVVEFGAAPDAKILGVRVAPWVASFSTANLAYAIDYASRERGADIISLSHGGSPSQMWTDAVNAAYERGTAMFAATGDFFALPVPGRINRLGLLFPPSSTVYPAGYRRVMGVSGATAAVDSSGVPHPYALTHWPRFLTRFWDVRGITHHFMRGSYGADGARRSILFGNPQKERSFTDQAMVKRNNELRANTISTYAPNITWLQAGKKKEEAAPHLLHLSGAGTSSSAPQAAAAAAHWLALNKSDIEKAGTWRSWEKAESVYTAMLAKADRPWDKHNAPYDQEPNLYLGAGILKANDMLDMSYEEARRVRGKTLSYPHSRSVTDVDGNTKLDERAGEYGVTADFYDGERSFYNLVLNPIRRPVTDYNKRANASKTVHTEREPALKQLFFNMLLTEKWQYGKSPLRDKYARENPTIYDALVNNPVTEGDLWGKAERLAKAAVQRADESKTTALGRLFTRRR
jgi:hypothetical protein